MTVDDEINQLERALALDPACRGSAKRLFHLYERQGRLLHFESDEALAKAAKHGVQLAKPISKWRADLKSESLPDRYDAVRSLTKLGLALAPLLPELVEAFDVKHSERAYRLAFYRAFAVAGEGIVEFLPIVVEEIARNSILSEAAQVELTKIFRIAGRAAEPSLLKLAKTENYYSRIDVIILFGDLELKLPAVMAFLEDLKNSSDPHLCLAALMSLRQLTGNWSQLQSRAISVLENMPHFAFHLSVIRLFRDLGSEAWPLVRVILQRIDVCPSFTRRLLAEQLGQIDFGSPENNEQFQSFCTAELRRRDCGRFC